MSAKLRVLFVIGSMRPGGSERQVVNSLRFLDRTRFTPLLYLIERTGELLAEIPDDVAVVSFSERCKPPAVYVPGGIRRRQIHDLRNVLESERIDLVCDRTWQMTLLAGASTRRSRVRRVSTGATDPQRVMEFSGERFLGIKRFLLGRYYRSADFVAAVSEGVREALIRTYRLRPDRVEVLRNMVDLERIDRLAGLERPPLEPDRFHIVAVGRLVKEKGYEYLLRAVDRLIRERNRNELLVHLLGEGPARPDLEVLVQANGLESHVRFEGYQPNPYGWMSSAHLFCLPSLYEGMPNALLEALACRAPAIASDCPYGPAEILDRGRYGRLVPPADDVALADAIEDALLNYSRWQARTAPARRFVEETFSPQAAIANLQRLLLSVAGERHDR